MTNNNTQPQTPANNIDRDKTNAPPAVAQPPAGVPVTPAAAPAPAAAPSPTTTPKP